MREICKKKMIKNKKPLDLQIGESIIRMRTIHQSDFLSLTDIAKYKNPDEPKDVIKNWLRNKNTLEFMGLWERLNNPDFKGVEFDTFYNESGTHSFTLSPERWIEKTAAIGIQSARGRSGGTFAHKDIAFEFATWISASFKLYLITAFQKLKSEEQKSLAWTAKRELAKVNYHIHTHAIRQHLVPLLLSKHQIQITYANEADVLNVALFGKTAKQWREEFPNAEGNIRDMAGAHELICLSNLESMNAWMIGQGKPQQERLVALNQIAIQQMTILLEKDSSVKIKPSN